MDVNAVGEKAGLESILLSKLSVIKKTNFTDLHYFWFIQKDAETSLLGIPNTRHWSAFGMHIRLGPSLMLHINWIILSMWTCKRRIMIMIITQIEGCPSQSSMIKWTVPKQPHHILFIESRMDSLSYPFWLHVIRFSPMSHS